MSSRSRAVAILAWLTRHPTGLPLRTIAANLGIPLAATERLLLGLTAGAYVHHDPATGLFRLRPKLAALGLAYLGTSGVTDLVQPVLDDLAKRTRELVRLAVIEGDRLTWVAKAQGARSGLFYTPDADAEVYLPATANGQAWLARLSDPEARRLIATQELGRPGLGPNAPADLDALLVQIAATRLRGYASVSEAYETGTSAMAAAIRRSGTGDPIGTVSIAGPTLRMTPTRMEEIAPWLLASAEELASASVSSPLFAST
jgi:IclR family acetate operon transcriptional repressor